MSETRTISRFQVRTMLIGLGTALWIVAVCGRLVYLTVIAKDSLRERGELQHQHTLKLDPNRGTIRDRNGRELARSVEVESVYAVPRTYSGDRLSAAARRLASCLELSEERIATRLEGDKRFVWLERKAKPKEADCVRGLQLAGVGFVPESRRFYPKRFLAAQILGYVGLDNEGMSGVEYALEEQIRGGAGRRIIWSDARQRRAASRVEKPAIPGRSVHLTIDENLQYIAETELQRAVNESGSKKGIAILIRPDSGEILAMAATPSFNPNRYGDYPASHWRNRSVMDVYEPGSTFKIVAAAAALEEGVTTEDERIDCGGGFIRVAEHIIRDHRVFDVLDFREVIELSSNVGMIRIGQRLGRERLDRYIRAFGFGEASDIELSGESRGLIRPVERWGPVTVAAISFGQEIGVTPLQMVTAANVIAASGYLMRPRLVLGFENPDDGTMERRAKPEPIRRVVSEKTARRVTELLLGVVEHGTGKRAAIEGYSVAGKTGTAQKAVVGGYSDTDFIASFVGFSPAHRPSLTALVILDSPVGDHSGSRAGAVFSDIVGRSLRYLGVPTDGESAVRVAKVWPQTDPILETADGEANLDLPERSRKFRSRSMDVSESWSEEDRMSSEAMVAPAVIGLPARDALARFFARGLVPELVGAGWVVEQYPLAGEHLKGTTRPRLMLALPGFVEVPEVAPPLQHGGKMQLARARILHSTGTERASFFESSP